jgi:hypothetical protein
VTRGASSTSVVVQAIKMVDDGSASIGAANDEH